MVAYWKAFIKNLVARCKVAAQVTLFIQMLLYSCMQWMILLICDTYISLYLWIILSVYKIWLIHSTYFIHPLFLLQSWLYYSFLCICPSRALDLWINICIANLKFYLFVFHISNLLGLIFLQSFITTQTLLQVSNKINCEWNLWS